MSSLLLLYSIKSAFPLFRSEKRKCNSKTDGLEVFNLYLLYSNLPIFYHSLLQLLCHQIKSFYLIKLYAKGVKLILFIYGYNLLNDWQLY